MAWIALCMLLVAFVIRVYYGKPSVNSVDGTYKNTCCADIIIKNGYIIHGNNRFKFKLEKMKFGTTAYVNAYFTDDGMEKSPTYTSIIFDTGKPNRSLDIQIGAKEYNFTNQANRQM